MHENEYEVNEGLVHALLRSQCPQWENLPLRAVPSSGTEHVLYRLGDKHVVRLPRLQGATETIDRECEWLPRIAKFLKVPISAPVFKGRPSKSYPSFWTITKWNEGPAPSFEKGNQHRPLAKDLAEFLNQLQQIDLANGPYSRRGVPLKNLDEETSEAISKLEGALDTERIKTLWGELSRIPYWSKKPVWVHGDLLPSNVLVQDNRLSAVIDFSAAGIGDPACDLVIAWSLFNANSRRHFRDNLAHVDDETWERGRSWALSIALIILPYYRNSNASLVSVAERMIEQLLEER